MQKVQHSNADFELSTQATTPVDPRVLDAMLPYLTDQYGNPHSRTHAYGWEAEEAVENARKVNTYIFIPRNISCRIANLSGSS